MLDEQLLQDFQAIQDEVEDLLGSLDYPGAPPEDTLRILVRIQHRLDAVTPGLVGRARARGAGWHAIGAAMSLTPDTVRHKYATAVKRYQQRLTPRHPRGVPQARRQPAFEEGPDSAPAQPGSATLLDETVPVLGEEFAPALSTLQRASGQSLRAVAEQARVSPSYLSRIIAGERIPSWPVTSRIARVCGAAPANLRSLWEKVTDQRNTKKEAPTLQSALRYLHLRAGRPDPAQLAAVSHTLNEHEITELLEGSALFDWETVQQLVFALDGEATYFAPLWHTAAQSVPPAAHPTQLPLTAPASPNAQHPTGHSGSWLSSAAHPRHGASYSLPAP